VKRHCYRLVVSLIAACCGGNAQRFDVVSIKPHPPYRAIFYFDRLPGSHEVRALTTLGSLIQMAYETTADHVINKSKGSSWVYEYAWDLDAKSERPFNESEMIAMLQNLLADRFKLQIEKEQKQGTVYVLTVDRSLKLVQNEEEVRSKLLFEGTPDRKFVLRGTAVTVRQFLQSRPFWDLRAPIVDSTGLTGRYDFNWVLGDGPDPSTLEAPNVIESCRRELGLKLQKAKGQIDVINITHVEKPSEN
jgi:uncharacterized protein (TIGR03435 family)